MTGFSVVITDMDDPDQEIEERVFSGSGLPISLRRCQVRDADALITVVQGADALIVQFAPITRDVVAALDRCRVISRYGVGVDMIDLEAAAERGIPVANVPDSAVDEVSTQTIGFVIDLNRHTPQLTAHVRAGRWGTHPLPGDPPRRLRGQTIGVVGLGRIGTMVAAKAMSLGMEVIGTDPRHAPGRVIEGVQVVELAELLRRADYVALHCPLVPETRGLIDAGALRSMKPTAFLINMARGPVVDQAALVAALHDRAIAGAALDVLESEPPAPDDPLLAMDNVLITPHSSSWSAESLQQLRHDAAQNVVDALLGRLPRSVVNGVRSIPTALRSA